MGIHKYNAEKFLPLLEEFSNRLNLNDREKEYLTREASEYLYYWTEEQRISYKDFLLQYQLESNSIVSRFQTMTPEEFKLNFQFIDDWCRELNIWEVILENVDGSIKELWYEG